MFACASENGYWIMKVKPIRKLTQKKAPIGAFNLVFILF
jgi:hypothetical protein